MTGELFYDIYIQLSKASTNVERETAVDALARACRAGEDRPVNWDERLAPAKTCITRITQSKELFATAVAKCIVRDNDAPLAKAIIHDASVRCMKQSAAVHYDLSESSEEAAILAACRLCSIYVTPAISLGWSLSLLTSYPNSDNARTAAANLVGYHLMEFPETTLRLLETSDSAFAGVPVADEALEFLKREKAHLDSLSRLREFTMTPEMRLTLAAIRRRQNRDIQEHSRQKSIFMQLCKVDHFKYAHKTSVEISLGAQTQEMVMEMAEYSIKAELPVSEHTDPVIGATRRRQLWKGIHG